MIDPKPFVGDPAYDATQHLLQLRRGSHVEPLAAIERFADLLELDHERVRLWMFAARGRVADEPSARSRTPRTPIVRDSARARASSSTTLVHRLAPPSRNRCSASNDRSSAAISTCSSTACA